MNKVTSILTLLVCIGINPVFSQGFNQDFATIKPEYQIKEFEILQPEYHIQNSLYHSIDVIDSRNDKTNLGIVKLGPFNHEAKVIPKFPLSIQLQNMIQSLIDSSAKNGELLFQLKQFKFAEGNAGFSESGYCNFKAGLYSKSDNHYQMFASIDTILVIKSMDVTKELLKDGSKIITDFISNNLSKEANGSRYYSRREILKMDSTEKRDIIVYNTDTYAEGLYYDYKSFSNQIPDKPIFVETKKDGRISQVNIRRDDNNMIKLKSKDIYAIVYNGTPYMATQYGYYPVTKSKDDFYFTGKINVKASTGDIMTAQMMLGLAGALLVSNANARYEMMIDHTNGSFIRIREIKFE